MNTKSKKTDIGGELPTLKSEEHANIKNGEKSCTDCFHKEVCGAYIDMNKMVEQFNMGWGNTCVVPCEPWDLAKNCNKYVAIKKYTIPEGINPPPPEKDTPRK